MAKKKKDDDRIGIVVDSRLHIPVKVVDAPKIIKKLTRYQFEDGICKNCEFRPQRPSAECNVCESGGLVGVTVLGKLDTVEGKKVVSIPYGEMHRFPKLTGLPLDRVRFINKTTRVPYDYDVEFTGELREYQKKPVADLMDELCGLLKAPPRSGKTVCGTYVACAHGYKTVIMADQKDFLDGFYETIEKMTNLPELEEEHGKKLFGFPKKLEDFENFQIILITYQSLLEKSKVAKKRLKLLNKHFGTIVVDEIHAAGAPTYTKILASLKMKYRYGLTATPKRKDCFTAGHKVRMSDGSLKNIEDIEKGDMVVAFDHATGLKTFQPVMQVHKVVSDKRKLRIHHEHGVLECTEDHQIWSESRGCYVNAIDLTTDDVLKLY